MLVSQPSTRPSNLAADLETASLTPEDAPLVTEVSVAPMPTDSDRDEQSNSKWSREELLRAHCLRLAHPDLNSHHDLALTLERNDTVRECLDIEDPPSRSTLTRAWRERFAEMQRDRVREQARRIRVRVRGAVETTFASDTSDSSASTSAEGEGPVVPKAEQWRLIDELRSNVHDIIEFNRGPNTSIPRADLLDAAAFIGSQRVCPEDGVGQFGNKRDRPSFAAETLRKYMRELDVDQILSQLDEAVEQLLEQARANSLFSREVTVQIDTTDVGCWMDRTGDLPHGALRSTKDSGPTSYRWLTVSATSQQKTFTLVSLPVTDPAETSALAMTAIERAMELVNIDVVLADSEFIDHELLEFLETEGLSYLFRKRKTARVRAHIDAESGTEPFVTDFDLQTEDNETFATHLIAKLEESRSSDETESGGDESPRDEDDDYDADSTEWVAFLTNLEGVTDANVWDVAERYRARWCIETDYRVSKHSFLAKTASRSFELRQFLWMFACLLYNAWILLRILLEGDPDVVEDDIPTADSAAHRFWDPEYG